MPGWQKGDERSATTSDVLRRSCSNAIFLRGSTAAAIGDFDPTLGLGTSNVSGEDTDYAIRASFAAERTTFVDRPIVGHHEADLAMITKYFRGDLIVASRYATRTTGYAYEFARKLAVGIYLVVSQRLKPAEYMAAVRDGMGVFGRTQKRLV